MGQLLSSVLGWFKGKPNVRILILGLDAAGKTTIIQRLQLDKYVENVAPTVSFNLERVEVGNLKLELWDLGGQNQLRPFWRYYYKDTNGVVFVIDSADKKRIDLCRDELLALTNEEELSNVPIVIMANKQDKEDAMSVEEITSALHLATIKDRAWTIVPGSALTGEGIKESFEWLSGTVEEKIK